MLLLASAAAVNASGVTKKPAVNFLPCSIKQHLIEADWWACTAAPSLPVFVYGAYEKRVPMFFAHVYLDNVSRDIAPPSVVWSDPRGLVSFSAHESFEGPAAAVAAPGYQILTPAIDAHRQERSGKTTLVAQVNGSIKTTLRVPALVYRTLSVGCYGFARADGLTFTTGDSSAAAQAPAQADLYVTGPAGSGAGANPGPGYGCTTAFADTTGDYVLHFPGGGTFLKITRFDRLGAAAWKNGITSISLQDIKDNALIFKTHGGTVVKALVMEDAQGRIGGVYETANTHGVFPY